MLQSDELLRHNWTSHPYGPFYTDCENHKTVSYIQESHSDGTDGNNGCDVQWQRHKVLIVVRSGSLTEIICEVCSSQYRSRSTQLSP